MLPRFHLKTIMLEKNHYERLRSFHQQNYKLIKHFRECDFGYSRCSRSLYNSTPNETGLSVLREALDNGEDLSKFPQIIC